ncbi:hypothetical protein GQ457_04G023480 [Hibiscus cannabinus]
MKAISPLSTAAIILHSHHHCLNQRCWFLYPPPRLNPKAADSTSQPSVAKTIVNDDGFSFSKYAELKPVPCVTYSDAQMLRETYATPILKQVLSNSGNANLFTKLLR